MIIDCHGHYTTAPKALEAWRNRQIAGIKDPAQAPKVADLKISDDELREFDRDEPAAPDEGARLRPHDLQPPRQLHGPSHRRFRRELDLGLDLQRALLPRLASCFPTISSARRCCRRAPASIRRPAFPSSKNASGTMASSPSTSTPIRPGATGQARRSPTAGGIRSTRRWSSGTFRRWCMSRPAAIPAFHTTGAHYINADTTAVMQFIQGSAVQGFPDAALRRSARRRRRALSLGPLSRACAGTEEAAPHRAAPEERLLRHLRLSSAGRRSPDQGDPGRQHPVRQRNDRRGAGHRPRDRPLLRRHQALHRGDPEPQPRGPPQGVRRQCAAGLSASRQGVEGPRPIAPRGVEPAAYIWRQPLPEIRHRADSAFRRDG